MAKKQVKRWYVRRIAKFDIPMPGDVFGWSAWPKQVHIAITHEGLKALEQAKKGSK